MELNIGILGTRGIPNHYGGFEHFAAHVSPGLVKKGHRVTVYNSSSHPYQQKEWQGVSIRHCYDPENTIGIAGQFVYDLNCILDARRQHYDIILFLGYTSSSIWKFLFPCDAIVITNMDGLEWKRTKYSKPVRKFLQLAERLAVQSSRFHIADSPVIKDYLDRKYEINSRYIAYGASVEPVVSEDALIEYRLRKNGYYLLMARMEPENNIEMILDGYCASAQQYPFVVIGNTDNRYGTRVVQKYDSNIKIIFLGAVFDEQKVQVLTAGCRLYFHGHSVGGTNPSLLDAMASRIPIAAHDNPFNRSLLQQNAPLFQTAADVTAIIGNGQYANAACIGNNYATILESFTWEMIIEQYEHYFLECYAAVHSYQPLSVREKIRYKEQY